ncbi:M56 family metallopeptidase [Nocardioides korecus]
MIASVALIAYAVLAGTFGVSLLRRTRWAERAPRLGIVAWQALSGSLVASVVLAGLSLAVPVSLVTSDLAGLLDTCVMLLRAQYSTPGGAAVSTVGLMVSLVVLGRVAQCLVESWRTARAGRARQRTQLSLIARPDKEPDVVVLDHASCAAYCVPGRAGQIVITTAARDALDPEQMSAVLAHERAHLRGRHHLVIQFAASLRAAFPFVPAFRHAEDEVARLTEMAADDAAMRTVDRLTLATALVRLAEGSTPAGALGAGGSTALVRVRRLVDPAAPLNPLRRLATLAGVALILITPLAVAAAPALAVVSAGYCPVSLAT